MEQPSVVQVYALGRCCKFTALFMLKYLVPRAALPTTAPREKKEPSKLSLLYKHKYIMFI